MSKPINDNDALAASNPNSPLSPDGVAAVSFPEEKNPDQPVSPPSDFLFGTECDEQMLYEPDHRPVRVYPMYSAGQSVGNPDGLADWWKIDEGVSVLLSLMSQDYAKGFRRFMFFLPGGSRSDTDINPNHWYTLSANKRADIENKMPSWLEDHPNVELMVYSGFLIDPQIENLSSTLLNHDLAVIPDTTEPTHAVYLFENWSPWFNVGVRCLMFNDCSEGLKAIGLKNLAYAYSLAQIRVRGNAIPLTDGEPNEYVCQLGWADFHENIQKHQGDLVWTFDPSSTEIGVLLRSEDAITQDEIDAYARSGYVLFSFGAWFDTVLDDAYDDITLPLIAGTSGNVTGDGNVFDTVTEKSSDPILGFGVSRYREIFSGAVGDPLPQGYEDYEIVCIANSVDGTFEFAQSLDKYKLLQVDITSSQFSKTGLPHWVVEDTMEWVNSGLPSHLSQVQHCNVVNVGIVHERNFPGLQAQISTPYQAFYSTPCSVDWYDSLESTIFDFQQSDSGNRGISLPYAACVLYIPEDASVWVGGIGGLIRISVSDLSVSSITVDTRRSVDVQAIVKDGNIVYILSKKSLYLYDLDARKMTKEEGLGLPNNLYSFAVSPNKNLVVGGEDGIYAKKPTQDEWNLVAKTTTVSVVSSPDSVFAVAGQQVWYSVDGYVWSNIGSISSGTVNSIQKHRSHIYVATDSGLFEDNGSFYGGSTSVNLVDVLDDPIASSAIGFNDVRSDFDRAIFGLSDGRYAVYETDYEVFDDSKLETVHRALFVENDIWLFGYDCFRVMREERIRKLATGSRIIEFSDPETEFGLSATGGAG